MGYLLAGFELVAGSRLAYVARVNSTLILSEIPISHTKGRLCRPAYGPSIEHTHFPIGEIGE
jgi:hypothetical protein